MEEEVVRHHPNILQDPEYLERRPIGMAYEKAAGYEAILGSAGFREIESRQETMTFVSTDEEEWWREMQSVGWGSLLDKVKQASPDRLPGLKGAIFADLQRFRKPDGIRFDKTVFFVCGVA